MVLLCCGGRNVHCPPSTSSGCALRTLGSQQSLRSLLSSTGEHPVPPTPPLGANSATPPKLKKRRKGIARTPFRLFLLRGPDLHRRLEVMLTTTAFTASNDFVAWTMSSPFDVTQGVCRLVSTPSLKCFRTWLGVAISLLRGRFRRI